MSRIGTFADDDLAGWVLKSPALGGAIGAFANAVYSKNRLPMRTRELARTVIAHSNECEVCVNTLKRDWNSKVTLSEILLVRTIHNLR